MRTGLIPRSLILALLTAAMLLPGCARNRVNQQLLERELRLQEDCIYRLKWALEDSQHALDDARQQVETAKKEADVLRGKASAEPDLSPPSSILAPSGGGDRNSEAPRLPAAPNRSGPLVEPGVEIAPPVLPPAPGASGGRRESPRNKSETSGPELTQASAVSVVTPTRRPIDSSRPAERLNPNVKIDRIVLNESLSGGLNLDGKPGDELLSVAIEQRDEKDARIMAPGDVSIVVVDPAIDGRAANIARWDFDADEVAKHVRRNRNSASLQFELPWPNQPQHSDLRLFVRFTTYDGRKLEANLPIEVQLAGGAWTKSRVSLAKHEEAEGQSTAGDASPAEAKAADAEPTDEPPPAAGRRSKWAPNR